MLNHLQFATVYGIGNITKSVLSKNITSTLPFFFYRHFLQSSSIQFRKAHKRVMHKSVSWFRVNTVCLGKAVLSPYITATLDPQPQRQENYAFTVDSINQWASPGVHQSSHIISPPSTLPSPFPSLSVSSGLIMEEESIGLTNTSTIWGRAALAPSSRCMSSTRLTANEWNTSKWFLATRQCVRVLRPRGAVVEQMCRKICYSS